MAQTVWGLGVFLILVFFSSAYMGYTKVVDAGATLTATVKHAIAGAVMKPANAPTGGGYVNEGLDGSNLQLNLSSLTTAVQLQLPHSWPGSTVVPTASGGLRWTLPRATNVGYGLTGPAVISAVTESSNAPPTLTATVAIPIAVPTWVGTWHGVIHREIVLPLAGQTGPKTFVPYNRSWMDLYQTSWPIAQGGTYSSQWFSSPAIGPGSAPNANVPNGIWFASSQFSAPISGSYRITVLADDGAALYLDGQLIATATLNANSPNGVTVTKTLTAGSHVLDVEVTNNDGGSASIVPDNSGGDNPSALMLTATAPNGQIVATTAQPNTWRIDAYPNPAPIGATTSGTLP